MSGNAAFSKKDLGMFLSSEAGDIDSLRHTVDDTEMKNFDDNMLKAKHDPTKKVKRWRKGMGIEAEESDEESDSEEEGTLGTLGSALGGQTGRREDIKGEKSEGEGNNTTTNNNNIIKSRIEGRKQEESDSDSSDSDSDSDR
jgi:hypothetical protein